MDQIKVLFVDDEPRLRTVWERLIGMQDDMACAGTLACADDLPRRAAETGAHIALLDLTMPGRDPIEVAAEVAERCPDCRVVIYSGHNDPESMRRAHEAGAWGYVDKLDEPDEILAALRRIAAGEPVFPRSFTH